MIGSKRAFQPPLVGIITKMVDDGAISPRDERLLLRFSAIFNVGVGALILIAIVALHRASPVQFNLLVVSILSLLTGVLNAIRLRRISLSLVSSK